MSSRIVDFVISKLDYSNKSISASGTKILKRWPKFKDPVVKLTERNFAQNIIDRDYALILWCDMGIQNCRRAVKPFNEAAAQLAVNDPPVYLAHVEVDKNPKLSNYFGAQIVPKLTFFNKGVASDYTGGRNSRDLIAWVKRSATATPLNVRDISVDEDIVQTDIDLDSFV